MRDLPRAAITGIGAAVPKKIMSNEDFEKILDTSDEWITQRTGIKQRHIASADETTASLAAEAAEKAIAKANLVPEDIELIICATISPEMPFPSTACFVQDKLGLTGIPAFDISAACSGFVYALTTASQFIQAGMYKRILVIGADLLSKFADFTDRSSCILFGDAAGAAVLEATNEPDKGIIYSTLHADGAGWDYIHVPAGGTRQPTTEQTVKDRLHFVSMRGRDVYKFAIEKMQWLLGDCMDKCGLTIDDIDVVIPHQVNIRIIKSATEKFNFPLEKVYTNLDRFGNTSAASIPVAMTTAMEEGVVKAGQTIVIVAFGAGLTWAGSVIKL